MKKILLLSLILGSVIPSSEAKSIFFPENGNYKYDMDDINLQFEKSKADYLIFQPDKAISSATFKLLKRKNEYQIKDWFKQDWNELQDIFSFDLIGFNEKYGAADFNQAKRNQYSHFPFDKKRYIHLKTIPAMREWGGLTHPPVKKLKHKLELYDSNFSPMDYGKVESPFFDTSLQLEIDKVSRSELTFKNKLKAVADIDAFILKKKLIKEARDSIFMSSLVFVCDASTKELVNLLVGKKQEGVDVRVIVDAFISKVLGHRECLHIMRKAGIEVLETKDFLKYKNKAIYHSKTLMTDFKKAIAGGTNMIDADNTSLGTDFKNRDVDLYVEGAMVSDIIKQFLENWQYHHKLQQKTGKITISSLADYFPILNTQMNAERESGLRGQNRYRDILNSQESRMDGVCRFIKQAPYEDRHTIGKAYLKLLPLVKKHLVITDPIKSDTFVKNRLQLSAIDFYDNFDMYNQLHVAVQDVAKSGKRIDYITTNIDMAGNENVAMLNEVIKEQVDEGHLLGANWSLLKLNASNKFFGGPHYKNLLKDWLPLETVRIWTHLSFMHSKIFYFDRIVASVGSLNFQHNATDHAYESTSICMDESLNKQLDKILVLDMANSIPLIFSK